MFLPALLAKLVIPVAFDQVRARRATRDGPPPLPCQLTGFALPGLTPRQEAFLILF